MNILYYCPEYHSHNHGGRTHAREFLAALRQLPEIRRAEVWPGVSSHVKNTVKEKRSEKRSNILQRYLRLYRSFRPRYQLTVGLCEALESGAYDCLIIRVAGNRNIVLSKIKRRFPRLIICMEINALRFQEEFPDIWLRPMWQKLEVMRFRHADLITVVSTHLKNYLEDRGVSEEKIIINPNGVNDEVFREDKLTRERRDVRAEMGIPEHAFVLGYVGGMEKFRRLPKIVEYVANMRREGNERIFMLLVGDGESMQEVRGKVSELADDLDGWVKLTGWVEHKDVPEVMATFDIAMFPFTQPYCSPLKLFEYMGLGLPTVGPDVPAVRELFSDGVHLRLVAQDGSNFESIVKSLMCSPEDRNGIAKLGRDYVLAQFTWKINAQRLLNAVQGNARQ